MSVLVDPTPWKDDVVRAYLTATAQQKGDVEKFYDTHLDIDRVYAEFLPRYQDEFVTQEEFRDELIDAPVDDDIRTFIVRGETGSGKSQLCQWLDYELAGEGESEGAPDRIPLHIKANQTNLEHIIATLAEPLGEDPEIRQVTGLDAEKVADAIITNLEANPGQKLADADIGRIIREGELKSLLASNIRQYQKGLVEEEEETDFDPNLISKEDYRDLALQLGTSSVFHQNSDVLRQALRDEIHRHFSHVIGVDDFQGQLRDYAQRYVDELGKRPVIICEDVTTFSVLKEQLLDQIIQVESATYDIVLGYTTGFEQDDLQDALGNRGNEDALTYLKDRSEGYLSLTQDGVAYFLNDSLAVDLVRKYMDVIKQESGAEIDDSVEKAFEGLYPFNRAFIQLTYDRLLEEGSPRRTPRVLLQKVVRRVLLSSDPPYEVVDKNPNVDDQVTPIAPESYPNELQKLAKWYGYQDKIQEESSDILVHRGVLEAFDFGDIGEGVVEHEGAEYVAFRPNDAATRILGDSAESRPAIPVVESSERPERDPETELETGPDTGSETGSEPEPEREPDSKEESETSSGKTRREDQVNEFLEWIETGDDYPSSDVLRSGAESVLNTWYEPTRLANPNASATNRGIYYTRGGEVPVSIEGPDERAGLSVTLPFGKEYLDLYFEILDVGINDGELSEDATIELLRSWAANSVAEFRTTMRDRINSCLPPNLTIEHTILLGKFLLTNAEFGVVEFDRETVFDRRVPKDHREYESPIREALPEESGLRSTLGSLKHRRRDIEGLVDGFFLLKQNLVDHDRLAPVQREISADPERFIRLAQQIDTEQLEFSDAYKIGTRRSSRNQTNLTAFLDAISDYAIELSRLGDDDLESHFESALEPVRNWHDPEHRTDELASMLDTLMDCLGTFDETQRESWEETYAELTDDETPAQLDAFNETVSSFLELDPNSPLERMELLHEFQASRKEHLAWDVYQTFDEIIEALDDYEVDQNNDLEAEIRKLAGVEEYESVRSDLVNAVNSY